MIKYPPYKKNAQPYKRALYPGFASVSLDRLNNLMLIRVLFIYIILTFSTYALHEHTFAVWELKEQLQMLYINMWELLLQLEYVTPAQRSIVYQEIEVIQQQITDTMRQIIQHDQTQHP